MGKFTLPPQKPLLELLILATAELHLSTCFAEAPYLKTMKHKIENPRPGDFVFETSTRRTSSVGWLLCKRKEFVSYQDEPGGYEDTFWYVLDMEGEVQRWYNCEFKRIIESSHWDIERDDLGRLEWAYATFAAYEREKDEPAPSEEV